MPFIKKTLILLVLRWYSYIVLFLIQYFVKFLTLQTYTIENYVISAYINFNFNILLLKKVSHHNINLLFHVWKFGEMQLELQIENCMLNVHAKFHSEPSVPYRVK